LASSSETARFTPLSSRRISSFLSIRRRNVSRFS